MRRLIRPSVSSPRRARGARPARGLGARLGAIGLEVPPGAPVADVGAGDGRLAAWLRSRPPERRVIAIEISRAALARTEQQLAGLGVEVRAGDGLAPVAPGEVAVAVVAGMGGRKIAGILGRSPEVVGSLRMLVLQPMQHLDDLRAWLAAAGHGIEREVIAVHKGRRYTVLIVIPA